MLTSGFTRWGNSPFVFRGIDHSCSGTSVRDRIDILEMRGLDGHILGTSASVTMSRHEVVRVVGAEG